MKRSTLSQIKHHTHTGSLFKIKPLAVALGLALVSCAGYANQFEPLGQNSSRTTLNNADVARQQLQAKQTTASGMLNHYDNRLGKTTFLWAAQNISAPKMKPVKGATEQQFAAEYYLNTLTGLTAGKHKQNTATLINLHTTKTGSTVAKYKQQVQGIDVFNSEYNILLNKNLDLVASSGYFAASVVSQDSILLLADFSTPESAIQAAYRDLLGAKTPVQLQQGKSDKDYQWFDVQQGSNAFSFPRQPRAKKVFFDSKTGLTAAYYVEVSFSKADSVDSKFFSYVIDSKTKKVLFKKDLVSNDSNFSYRVYADETGYPLESPHGDVIPQLVPDQDPTTQVPSSLLTLSHYAKLSTQDPWLPEDSTMTLGTNVSAYADVVAPDGYSPGDILAEITSAKTFDYPLLPDEKANSINNRKAAIVNLFYMTNFLHNFYYDHGFDEAAGNAQVINYGRGGLEGDPLIVEAQDNSGLNNANMYTPADGESPIMQQYLWHSKDAKAGRDFGAMIHTSNSAVLLNSSKPAIFGQQQYSGIQAELVRLNDGTDQPHDGCEPAQNAEDLAGKIVIIDRGGCEFPTKALNAQQAGAIAVLIVNNVNDGSPAPMGGENAEVIIPAMGLNYSDGQSLYAQLDAGQAITISMFNNYLLKDSTFDNGIIAHEWGHYISNRLIGNSSGLNTTQSSAMGEGWGDFHALMFIARKSDTEIAGNEKFQLPYVNSTYVADFFRGIRRAPYSTDMAINPLTFKHIESGAVPPGLTATYSAPWAPHDAGEVWATMLWELYVSFINQHGFDEAQSRMADYLVAGYKMTPVSPTFTEARDAILSAAYAADPADFELVLKAFAKRGLGLGAVAPERDSFDNVGVTESYSTKLSSFVPDSLTLDSSYNGPELGYCSNDTVFDKGETATVTVKISSKGSETLTGLRAKVEVISGQNVSLQNNGDIEFSELKPFQSASSAPLHITLNEAATLDKLELKVSFPEQTINGDSITASELRLTTKVNYDFKKSVPVNNIASTDMETPAVLKDWHEHIITGDNRAKGTLRTDTDYAPFLNIFNPGINFGDQTMFLKNHDFKSDVAAETDEVEVGYAGNFSINFFHFYRLETGFDGAVVEVSVNGGEWVDPLELGAQFAVGYDYELEDNPDQSLQDRPVYTGMNSDFVTYGNLESINFGTTLNGNRVKFRFRISSDSYWSDFGWFIDNVSFTNVLTPLFSGIVPGDTYACDNVAPLITMQANQTVQESVGIVSIAAAATDRNKTDTLSYSWVQLSGPTVSITDPNKATVSFIPPAITADSNLSFQLTVDDGNASSKATTEVLVKNETPVVATPPVKHNSGGGFHWLSLLAFPLLFGIRRRLTKV